MEVKIEKFIYERIEDVIQFELQLRAEEDDWGWEINDEYVERVKKSFHDSRFHDSLSLLAYVNGKAVGRIDSTLICSHFDGSVKAYLDWICVLKSYRHKKIAQRLMSELRFQLKELGADTLVAVIAQNKDAQNFYKSLEGAVIRDQGIWIDL